MRTRLLMLSAALVLASGPGEAQTPPVPLAPAQAAPPLLTGAVDFGGVLTATDGDGARYERYRDDRSGVYSNIRLNRDGGSYLFDAAASQIGYRDQRYSFSVLSRRVNVVFDWVSIPLNYSYETRTPFDGDNGTLTLPDSAQAAVQGPTDAPSDGTAVGVPCAPGAPPASCGTPALAAQAKANRSIYNSIADTFDLRHARDTAVFGLKYMPTRELDVDAQFATSMREGEQPWGASFAFNNAIEVPKPLDEQTNDVTIGTTWANPRSMFRLAWDGSWFTNDLPALTWDNPIRLTDFNNGLPPPAGPYHPSGYSNGNGPAQGRMALAPANMMHVVSATGLYKMPARTTVNGTVQLANQRQDENLIPWTINPVINSPAVFAAFPGLAALPRATAEAEARGINALVNLSSRPWRMAGFTVRYRYNDRDVRTPPFDARQYVRVDAVPEEIEEGISHQFDTTRQFLDANVSFTPSTWGTLRIGYGHEATERHGRGFADVGEHIVRLSFDTFSSQWMTVRASFDAGRRRGEGFVEAASGNDELDAILGPGGTQPTLRYYDEADRNRIRGSLMFSVFPRDTVDLYVQYAGGRDEYLVDDSAPVSRPGELFGLHESAVTSVNVGVNVHPTDVVSLGANYGRDTYSSLQLSRNANPPPDPSWTDPNRNWTLDNDDNINTFSVFLDLMRAVRNTDIRFGYDYSDSSNSYVHGGPRVATLAAAGQFIPLPDVDNTWQRATADVDYFFTTRVGVGVGYYFEKLEIVDFNTIDSEGPVGFAPQTGEPRIDWLGGLLTGYGNRPYTGNTGYVRVLYRF